MLTACQLSSFALPFSEQVLYDWQSVFLYRVPHSVPFAVLAIPVLKHLEFLLQY